MNPSELLPETYAQAERQARAFAVALMMLQDDQPSPEVDRGRVYQALGILSAIVEAAPTLRLALMTTLAEIDADERNASAIVLEAERETPDTLGAPLLMQSKLTGEVYGANVAVHPSTGTECPECGHDALHGPFGCCAHVSPASSHAGTEKGGAGWVYCRCPRTAV